MVVSMSYGVWVDGSTFVIIAVSSEVPSDDGVADVFVEGDGVTFVVEMAILSDPCSYEVTGELSLIIDSLSVPVYVDSWVNGGRKVWTEVVEWSLCVGVSDFVMSV